MTKKDLRTGHIITTRGGRHFRVMLDAPCVCTNEDVAVELNGERWTELSQFNEDMISNRRSENDIVKVEMVTLTTDLAKCDYDKIPKRILWERPTYYNGKVVCIEACCSYLTRGKIYEFKDGLAVDDIGDRLPMWGGMVKSVEHLNELMTSKFIEVVEE